MCHFVVFLALFISAFLCVKSADINNIVNLEVHSVTDLKNQFAVTKNVLLFVNKGPTVVRTYEYAINESGLYNILFYDVQGNELDFKETNCNKSELCYFEVTLNEDVLENKKYMLMSKLVYAGKISPAQKQRKFEEDQLVKFEGSTRFFSSYVTELSKIEYLLRNDSWVDLTKDPTRVTNGSVIYINSNIKKFDTDPVELFFVNNDAFLVIKSLHRTIDVNHFGKITIEDRVVVQNNGPRFVGPYQVLQHSERKAMTSWLYTHLPASAENIKFFDILGNSSQTQIYRFFNYITLKFKTRYPLLGGWQTSYVLRYEVPVHEYLFISDSFYLLQIRAIDYILDGKLIENVIVKIVLPESARLKKINKPKFLSFRNEEVGCPGGLCIIGRPIFVLNGSNLFDHYIETVEVEYFVNYWCLLRAPLVISIYLEIIFIVIVSGKHFVL